MRLALSVLACVALASAGLAQATFDPQGPPCAYLFPVGCGAAGDIEGISWNGLGISTVDTANGAGFPCGGPQYGRVVANGPYAVPAGGPMPEPLPGVTNQLYIPIPPAAIGSTVTLCWDFYNAEGGPTATFNDGMSIDIVGAPCGPSIFNLAYADTYTPAGPGTDASPCGSGALERLVAGPEFVGPITVFPGDAYIRVTVWNGGDNAVSSHGVIDEVCFAGIPCVAYCLLGFSSPLGPGSLAITNTTCPPAAGYSFIMPLTVTAGAFPAGWLGGIDISWTDLMIEFAYGFPFTGTLDGTGGSLFSIPAGVPSGLTLYGNTLHFLPGYGAYAGARFPTTYTTP